LNNIFHNPAKHKLKKNILKFAPEVSVVNALCLMWDMHLTMHIFVSSYAGMWIHWRKICRFHKAASLATIKSGTQKGAIKCI
jgi:hypothetical protein